MVLLGRAETGALFRLVLTPPLRFSSAYACILLYCLIQRAVKFQCCWIPVQLCAKWPARLVSLWNNQFITTDTTLYPASAKNKIPSVQWKTLKFKYSCNSDGQWTSAFTFRFSYWLIRTEKRPTFCFLFKSFFENFVGRIHSTGCSVKKNFPITTKKGLKPVTSGPL